MESKRRGIISALVFAHCGEGLCMSKEAYSEGGKEVWRRGVRTSSAVRMGS